MLTVAVTGASGFIGNHLVKAVQKKHSTVAFVRQKPTVKIPMVKYCVFLDLLHPKYWEENLQKVDVLVHAIGDQGVEKPSQLDTKKCFECNLLGTVNIARQAAKAGVRRFIFISTIKVNGERTEPGKPFSTSHAASPTTVYGRSKWLAEQELLKLGMEYGMEVVIIRAPLVYGKGVKGNFGQLLKLLNTKVFLPFGGFHSKRSFLAIGNLNDLIMTCIHTSKGANQIFLASDDNDISISELVQKLASIKEQKVKLFNIPKSVLVFVALVFGQKQKFLKLISPLQVDITNTKEVLGWSPPVKLDNALRCVLKKNNRHI